MRESPITNSGVGRFNLLFGKMLELKLAFEDGGESWAVADEDGGERHGGQEERLY